MYAAEEAVKNGIIVKDSNAYKRYLADEVGKILGEGWSAGTYGSKGTGWKFMKGHLMVYYHEADGIHGKHITG